MKGMVLLKKIQLKAFNRRRNQKDWFHFCYVSDELWLEYTRKFPMLNMDIPVKDWLKEDFNFEIEYMEDIYEAKEHIKNMYAKAYPEVFLEGEGDRQGWTRVWLSDKMKKALEEQ